MSDPNEQSAHITDVFFRTGECGDRPISRCHAAHWENSVTMGYKAGEVTKYNTMLSASFSAFCVLSMVLIIPIWNAATLVADNTFAFFIGRGIPSWTLTGIIALAILCLLICVAFEAWAFPGIRNDLTWMVLVTMVVGLFGFGMMMMSFPISNAMNEAYVNLQQRCTYADISQDLHSYWAVLHNIRIKPGCLREDTVEDCVGFEDKPEFSEYIRYVEQHYKCATFCFPMPLWTIASVQPKPQANATIAERQEDDTHTVSSAGPNGDAGKDIVGDQTEAHDAPALHDGTSPSSQGSISPASFHPKPAGPVPDVGLSFVQHKRRNEMRKQRRQAPTLFHKGAERTSCQTFITADLKEKAGNVADNMFYQGLSFLCLALLTTTMQFFMLGNPCIPNC